jgi:hypothetical protein
LEQETQRHSNVPVFRSSAQGYLEMRQAGEKQAARLRIREVTVMFHRAAPLSFYRRNKNVSS